MLEHPNANESCWFEGITLPRYPALAADVTADVAIVGAGITGLTTAYYLAKAGKRVVVVDAFGVGAGETGRTTGHLTVMVDRGYGEIVKMHGWDKARQVAQSHAAAINQIEAITQVENIDCDFERVDGYLLAASAQDEAVLAEERETLERLGISTQMVAHARGMVAGPALRILDQAQFHPVKYLQGLLVALARQGVEIHGDTFIQSHQAGCVVTRDNHRIHAQEIVIATHTPVINFLFFLKEAAYRSFVIVAKVPRESVPHALYWDTEDPYHYVRLQPADARSDFLIIGGEDHKTGQDDEASSQFKKLETWGRSQFPMMQKIDYRWSGQIIEPVDTLAFIGKSPYHHHFYIATGYSGNGLTYGTLAGMILSDLILDRPNEWAEVYEPTRKTLKSAGEFIEENANMVTQLVGDWLKPEEIKAIDEVHKGEGAIVRKGMHKLAVYRDESGELSACSAVCPHLGCIVQWNRTEKTFDCPCHGSRYTSEGQLITGPSIKDLQKVKLGQHANQT